MADQVEAMRIHSDPTRAAPPPPDVASLSIADPRRARSGRLRHDDVRAQHVSTPGWWARPASRSCSGSRWPTAASRTPGGHVGVPQGNTFGATAFSSYGAFWFRTGRSLPSSPRASRHRGRSLPDRLGHLHVLHVDSVVPHHGGCEPCLPAPVDHISSARIGAASGTSGITKLGGWIGLATRLSRPGTRRSPSSPTSRSAAPFCRCGNCAAHNSGEHSQRRT
jgi:hypothetical protein